MIAKLTDLLSFIKMGAKLPFARNVTTLASGTALAQLIAIAASPILTRIYGAEAFGILGVFAAIVGIISTFATGRYDMAIMLPKAKEDAVNLLLLACGVASFVGLVLYAVIPWGKGFVEAWGAPGLVPYLYWIPLVVVLIGWVQSLEYWIGRDKEFKAMSVAAISSSAGSQAWMVGTGVAGAGVGGMISGNVIGHVIHLFVLWMRAGRTTWLSIRNQGSFARIKALAQNYCDFPKHKALQDFLNALSQNVPSLLLVFFFSPVQVGFFWLAQRVLKTPSMLMAEAFRRVFYQKSTEIHHNNESIRPAVVATTLGLTALGIIPFVIFFIFGPHLFAFVFGADWLHAGEYARWLSPWLFIAFINVPSVVVVPILGLQSFLLKWEIFSIFSRTFMFVFGSIIFKNDLISVIFYSFTSLFLNGFLILYIMNKCAEFDKKCF